jgi:predicted PurR-regulated permease PerM
MNAPTTPPTVAAGDHTPGSAPAVSAPEIAAAPAVIMIPASGSGVLTAGGVVLAIGGLYFGRDIFVPFALAVLLSFALAPLVLRLRRLRLPKVAAIVLAVGLAGAVIGGIAFVVAGQLVQLAGNLPSYQETISTKLQSLRSTAPGGGVVGQVTETIRELSQELSGPKPAPGSPSSGTFGQPVRTPIPVTIEPGSTQPVQIIQTILVLDQG